MKRTVHLGLLAIAPFLLFAVVRGAIALASHQLESQYPPPGTNDPGGRAPAPSILHRSRNPDCADRAWDGERLGLLAIRLP